MKRNKKIVNENSKDYKTCESIKKDIYMPKKKWAIATLCKGETDILELFIMWYHDKAEVLSIGLHNPTDRVLKLIETIKRENNISNLEIYVYENSMFLQSDWSNQLYKDTIEQYDDLDIYVHVDIDEFIYRFDVIEDNWEPNAVLKFSWLDVVRDVKNFEYGWVQKPVDQELLKHEYSVWDKTLYCIGDDLTKMKYMLGQHEIVFEGMDKNDIFLKHLNYPCFYHLAYRNNIQTYLKLMILINEFTERAIPLENTWGTHVLERFLNAHSPDYLEIFKDTEIKNFKIDINKNSLNFFSNDNVNKNPEELYRIDPFFYKEYFLKYYNEENSYLDFVEQDFINKMNLYKKNIGEAK